MSATKIGLDLLDKQIQRHVEETTALKARIAELEAKCAEMRDGLEELSDFAPWGGTDFAAFTKWVQATATKALTSDGSGYAAVIEAARNFRPGDTLSELALMRSVDALDKGDG